jgi:uncharacterized protein YbaP (TraB family)
MHRFVLFLGVLALALGCKSSSSSSGAPQPAASSRPALSAPSAQPGAAAPAGAWVPVLYRIDGAHPSYLLGTIHVGDPRLATFPPAVERDFGASQELVTEVVMDSPDTQRFAFATLIEDGKTLDTKIPPALWTRTQAAFSPLGVPASSYEHMKPWGVAVQLSMIDHLNDLKNGVDLRLTSRARGAGKAVSALENVDEQIDVFDKTSPADQVAMLDEALTQRDAAKKDGRDPIKELLDAYVSGDEAKIEAAMDRDYDPKNPVEVRLRKRLVVDRNHSMEERIATKIKDGTKSWFFAVGCAHVIGAEGIVALLRAAGVKVEREP